MGYAGANAWSAAGEAAQRWAQLLGQLYQGQQQQKRLDAETAYTKGRDTVADSRYADELKYRAGRDAAQDTHNQTMQNIATNKANADLEMSGYSQPGLAIGERFVAPELKPSGPLFNEPQPVGSAIGAALSGSMPSLPKRAPTQLVSTPGGYNPERDVGLQRNLQEINARSQPTSLELDQFGESKRHNQAMEGIARSNASNAANKANAPKGLVDLPAEVQKRYGQVRPAYDAHADYKRLTEQYLKTTPAKRGLEAFIPGDSPLIAELASAKERVKTTFKAVADLGALSGDDMRLMEGLIGDATDPRQIARDPQGALNRLKQAEAFLDSQANTLERNYGVPVDRPAKSMEQIIADYVKTIK